MQVPSALAFPLFLCTGGLANVEIKKNQQKVCVVKGVKGAVSFAVRLLFL